MAKLMEMLDKRRGSMPDEKFANVRLGISASTFSRYRKGTKIGTEALQKMMPVFIRDNDVEMVGAFAVYAIGVEVPAEKLAEIGQIILGAQVSPS